jgi:hypothetical protein
MDHRAHQRRDADVLERSHDRRIVVVERRAGVRVARRGLDSIRHRGSLPRWAFGSPLGRWPQGLDFKDT